jgi:hypothetical protein
MLYESDYENFGGGFENLGSERIGKVLDTKRMETQKIRSDWEKGLSK